MSTSEILKIIKQLPVKERLLLIEKALKTLHKSADTQLEKAAKTLMSDYQNDKGLTALTALDFEKFYEAR
ncbi:MAG TPA: hypothetical protein VI731_07310 [Bacteroidia bacterium]|nr:hypothetical protein [Bacteroidia bacterium]